MAVERLWEVFGEDGMPGILVHATSASDAARKVQEKHPHIKDVWPHRYECACTDILSECVTARLERDVSKGDNDARLFLKRLCRL